MGRLGFTEVLIVVVVAIMLFGTKKLPEIGQSIGKAIREFKKASRNDDSSEDKKN